MIDKINAVVRLEAQLLLLFLSIQLRNLVSDMLRYCRRAVQRVERRT